MQYGMLNEYKIIEAINEKKFIELNKHWQEIIKNILFKNIDIEDDSIIIAYKCENYIKPDIAIMIGDVTKFISIKLGDRCTMHQESIFTFMELLKSYNISDETIETLLLFLYGDGTTDGTGDHRFSTRDLVDSLYERLILANEELNSNKKLVRKVIERCVFEGVDCEKDSATFLYHGNKDKGIMCSDKEIIKFGLWKPMKWMFMPHIGPLVITPYLRDINNVSKNQYKRDYVNLTWRDLGKHMELIQKFDRQDNELKAKCYQNNPKLNKET